MYLEDISVDKLSADAPADETTANRDARRERNRKRNEAEYTLLPSNASCRSQKSHARLREYALGKSSPSSLKTLTSCRSTTGSTSPPARNRDNEATSRSADLGRNRTRAELPAQPNRTRANAGGPSQGGNSNREVIPHRAPGGGGRDPGGGGSDDGSSNYGANRRPDGGGSHGGRDHANSHASGASQGAYDARQKIEELRRKKSAAAGDNDGFPAFSPRLRNLLLPDKFKPLGITKYDTKQDPI
jgi:hypothetical protein